MQVTYKWLSKELGIHVNLAKQILWQFFKEHDKGKNALATFTLMGYLADGGLRVEVVKESDLSAAKQKFIKIKAMHLYSLQRALPDLELLALCENGDHKKGAIICKEIVTRSGEELRILRWGSKINNEPSTIGSVEKSTKPSQSKSISDADSHPESKAKKIGFADVFGRNTNRLKAPTEPPTFVAPNRTAAPSKDDKSVTLPRGRKRHGSKEREKSNKKLKFDAAGSRSSEESSSNEEEEEADTEMRYDPESAAPLKNNPGSKSSNSPPLYKIENGKKKMRKIVDKTSFDENGYLVTKKEYLYESSSDKDEDPVASKVEASKPRVASKANRKQASLLNFFKKS